MQGTPLLVLQRIPMRIANNCVIDLRGQAL